MSIQTEMKQEKEFFTALMDKIKESDKFLIHRASHVRRNRAGEFTDRTELQLDTISLEIFCLGGGTFEDKQLSIHYGRYVSHGENKGIVHLIVKDKNKNIIFDENCEMPESDHEENAKLQTARFKLGKKLFDVIVNRLEKNKTTEKIKSATINVKNIQRQRRTDIVKTTQVVKGM